MICKISDLTVLVFGDFMVDQYIEGDVYRISPEAPVPVLTIKNSKQVLGGAGNVANNLLSLGVKVRAITCVGNDAEGQWLVQMLAQKGADASYILQRDDVTTILKTRIVAKGQQFIRLDREKILDLADSLYSYLVNNGDEILKEIKAVVISDYGKGAVTEQTAQFLIHKAKARNIPVIVDPKGNDYTKYRCATVCTPNLKELAEACHRTFESEVDIESGAADLLMRYQFNYLLVTRSDKGISMLQRAKPGKMDFPAAAKEVIDVTGAGDTVVSTIALGLAWGLKIEQCCQLANRAAGIVVSKAGTATLTIDELVTAEGIGKSKIINIEMAGRIAKILKQKGKKVVFTNGCYDLLHAGHLSSLCQAKEFGDILMVGINGDDSVRRLKGKTRPVIDETNRAKMLAAVEYVDYVIIFYEDTPEKLVEIISPDIMVKGLDWKGKPVAGAEKVIEAGGRLEFIKLEPGFSTTNIINKISGIRKEIDR